MVSESILSPSRKCKSPESKTIMKHPGDPSPIKQGCLTPGVIIISCITRVWEKLNHTIISNTHFLVYGHPEKRTISYQV